MAEEIVPRQLFETEIGVHGTSVAARFVVVPGRALDDPDLLKRPRDLLDALELELLKPLPVDTVQQPAAAAAAVPAVTPQTQRGVQLALTAILAERESLEAVGLLERMLEAPPAEMSWLASSDVVSLAEQMTTEPMVPFEASPLGAESLLAVIGKGSGPAIGAAVAVAAFGATPLLLVAVPAGMIVGGAALGVGEALQLGLRNRLLRLMGVRPPEGDASAA